MAQILYDRVSLWIFQKEKFKMHIIIRQEKEKDYKVSESLIE